MTLKRKRSRERISTRTDLWRFSIAMDAPFDGRRGEKLRSSLFILQESFDKDHSSSKGALSDETLAAGACVEGGSCGTAAGDCCSVRTDSLCTADAFWLPPRCGCVASNSSYARMICCTRLWRTTSFS